MTRLAYSIPEAPRKPVSEAEADRREAVLLDRHPTMFDRGALQTPWGWLALVEMLCDEVHQVLPPKRRGTFKWIQIKEKFGGLRAYFAGSTDSKIAYEKIAILISEAEDLSRQICQLCGARGRARTFVRGWIATVCDACAKELRRKT